jgi:hypothetical protein
MYQLMGEFKIEKMAIRYSQFVPQLYNYCLSLGFERKKMMPSRAFCSDETQGYPAILLAQHFGTFPFDHGQVGGRVATDRNGPHAHHGEDLIIVQASHVGYDPSSRRFGIYQRQRTEQKEFGANCGKLNQVLNWYQATYRHASCAIRLGNFEGTAAISIDNALLNPNRSEGLFLHLDRLLKAPNIAPLRILSTSKVFEAGSFLLSSLPANLWSGPMRPIGTCLSADLFHFQREPVVGPEGLDLLERAVAPAMPSLVTSQNPMLDAARFHTQIEFDRAYRAIQDEPAYDGKNILFVSGLNVDISLNNENSFPMTKFVPWAAFARLRDGTNFLLEQADLFDSLASQSAQSPDRIALDSAIAAMAELKTIDLSTP